MDELTAIQKFGFIACMAVRLNRIRSWQFKEDASLPIFSFHKAIPHLPVPHSLPPTSLVSWVINNLTGAFLLFVKATRLSLIEPDQTEFTNYTNPKYDLLDLGLICINSTTMDCKPGLCFSTCEASQLWFTLQTKVYIRPGIVKKFIKVGQKILTTPIAQ